MKMIRTRNCRNSARAPRNSGCAAQSAEVVSAALIMDVPEYAHAVTDHLPLIGLLVAMLALIVALVTKNRTAILIGLALVSLLALSVWPVYHYGEAGYDRVLSMSDDAGAKFLDYHKALAERWVFLYFVTAGVAGVGLWWRGNGEGPSCFPLSWPWCWLQPVWQRGWSLPKPGVPSGTANFDSSPHPGCRLEEPTAVTSSAGAGQQKHEIPLRRRQISGPFSSFTLP